MSLLCGSASAGAKRGEENQHHGRGGEQPVANDQGEWEGALRRGRLGGEVGWQGDRRQRLAIHRNHRANIARPSSAMRPRMNSAVHYPRRYW
jgi:hypothetical protein